MRSYFVTGTDTGVGKTTVARALLTAARARGLTVLAQKPVETGCEENKSGVRVAEDAHALACAAAGTADAEPLGTVFALEAPLAPAVAAELEGTTISIAFIVAAYHRLAARRPDLLLVEGAGGLLVPLTADRLVADLASAIGAPLIIVARDGLGTINHTLLTVEAAVHRHIPIAGVVLNAAEHGTSTEDAARNADEIARRGGVRVLGRLPHLAGASERTLGASALEHLDLDTLLGPYDPASAR